MSMLDEWIEEVEQIVFDGLAAARHTLASVVAALELDLLGTNVGTPVAVPNENRGTAAVAHQFQLATRGKVYLCTISLHCRVDALTEMVTMYEGGKAGDEVHQWPVDNPPLIDELSAQLHAVIRDDVARALSGGETRVLSIERSSAWRDAIPGVRAS